MKLFVDDTRPFPKSEEFICCRDYNEATRALLRHEFEYVSLDFDLGDGPNGLDILLWIRNTSKYIPHINIHSSHIIGRVQMKKFCESNFPNSKITMNYPY